MTARHASTRVAATIGRNLRAARKGAGLTQHALAVHLGRGDAMTVSRWERGEHKPSDENLIALADLLGVAVADLFAEPQDDQPKRRRKTDRRTAA